MSQVELTILMPCLNEEESIGYCIREAQKYIAKSGITAEIVVADSGSTDHSIAIARELGARVLEVKEKGYGNVLRKGIACSEGTYIIMGDSDGSYDFSDLDGFVEKLRNGYELVIGNRYLGGIEKGAMPASHRWLGVPVLSFLGRLKYKVKIGDFHCGMRGFHRETAQSLEMKCEGMEFATEMIGVFARNAKKICQIPTVLRKDLRNRKPHLRTMRDGLRHLIYIIFG